MKLNNKGWSLNTLLICMAVILSFLLISVFYVYKLSTKLSNDLNSNNNSTNYSNNSSKELTDNINNNQNTNQNNNYNNNSNNNTDNNANQSNNDLADDNTNNESNSTSKNKYYTTKESQLQAATIRYLKENGITIAEDETIVINANDIINKKYIQSIKDERTNNICDGYSVASFKDNDYIVKSYIECDSYSSDEYGVDNIE